MKEETSKKIWKAALVVVPVCIVAAVVLTPILKKQKQHERTSMDFYETTENLDLKQW